MNRNTSLWFSAAALLVGCDAQTLTVGEMRCRNVSCTPNAFSYPELIELEPPRREASAMLPARTSIIPCDLRASCELRASKMALIERGGETFPLIAAHIVGYDEDEQSEEQRLWIGRNEHGEWTGVATFKLEDHDIEQYLPIAIAVSEQRPDEAIIALSEDGEPFEAEPHILKVLRYGSDDALELLFEDPRAGYVVDVAPAGDDVLVLDDYHAVYELTRYADTGAIRWRQSGLESPRMGMAGARYVDKAQLRVAGEDRIVALIPHLYEGAIELVVLDGAGELSLRRHARSPREGALGVFLDIDGSGNAIVGTGGYSIDRVALDGDLVEASTSRDRTEYYVLDLYAMDVAPSGWAYVATQDGLMEERIELLERAAPDSSVIEALPLETGEHPQCSEAFGSGDDQLRVGPDERTAYVANRSCLFTFSLPAVE